MPLTHANIESDAAVATGLTVRVGDSYLTGPAGDMLAIFHSATTGKAGVLHAQGVAPEGATLRLMQDQAVGI